MRKTVTGLLLLLLLAAVAAMVAGCGQISQQVNGYQVQPSGVTVRGTIFRWLYSGTNTPTIVNHYGNVVVGAYVALDGNGSVWNARTDSNGEYSFAGVPDGQYQLYASAEGFLHQVPVYFYIGSTYTSNITIKSSSMTAANNTVYTVPNAYWFDEHPWIVSYSPQPGSIISNTQSFTVTFCESMDVSTVRWALVPQGLRTYSVGDTANVTLSWSADERSVTITPVGSLASNESYRLLLNPDGHVALDKRGVPLNTGGAGFDQTLNTFADYRTPAGGVPSAPSNLSVVVNGKTTSEINYSDVISSGNTVALSWNPSGSGNITGYRVYVAREGSTLNFSTLEAASLSTNVTDVDYFTTSIAKVIKAVYNGQTDPIGSGNYPFINTAIHFKVVAFNGDGESAPAEASAKDSVGPTLYNPASPTPPYTGGPWMNNAIIPPVYAGETNRRYIAFTEPIDPSTIVAGNFSITGGLSITSVRPIGSVNNPGGISSIVEIVASGNLYTGAQTLTVSGVKDLAGNVIKTGVGDTITM